MAARKHRRLTDDQKRQIPILLHQGMNYIQIANKFGVSEDSIYRSAKAQGVDQIKYSQEEIAVAAATAAEQPLKNQIKTKRELLKNDFMQTDRYVKITKIYDKESLASFMEQWVDWHVQLKDVTPSEEDAIELAIMTKLRLQDNQEKYNKYNILLREMEEQLRTMNMTIDESDEEQRTLHEKIQAADLIQLELNKDIKDLLDKFNNLQKSLNASRQQREASQRVGGDTFTSLVVMLTDRHRREDVERDEERWRIATENKIRKMKEPIQFEDGTEDPMILDGADYLDKNLEKEEIDGSDEPDSA